PTQSQIYRQCSPDFPVILKIEPIGGRPVAKVLEGESAGFSVEVYPSLLKRLVGRKIERILKIECRTVEWARERGIVLVPIDIKPELEGLRATIVRHHVAPVEIVLYEAGWSPTCPESRHPSHIDGRYARVAHRRSPVVQRETHGRFVDQVRREHVREVYTRVIGFGWRSRIERRARAGAALLRCH